MNWSEWKPMPSPELCRKIIAPLGPGIYQIRNKVSNTFVLFGIGKRCQQRMKSLYPAPFGTGTRNNKEKRDYILQHWENLEYRTLGVETRSQAKLIEDGIKAQRNHIFNET